MKLLVAGSDGRGFVVGSDDLLATTRKGRSVLNVDPGVTAIVATPVAGDHVATIGANRKLLVFPRDQLPEMTRGKGVRLQRIKAADLKDAKVFDLAAAGRGSTPPAAPARSIRPS